MPAHAADTVTVAGRLAPPNGTLVELDCLGEARPGLAAAWERHEGGRRWRFHVDRETHDRLDSRWRRDGVAFDAGIDSTAFGDGRMDVCFSREHRGVPRVLSHPALGIPVVEPRTGHVRSSSDNARDLLENTVDVMITSDPAVVDYASTRPDLTTSPLPWSREYVLLSTSRVEAIRRGEPVAPAPPELSGRLARDAVRGEARASERPAWWADYDRNCDDLADAAPWSPPRPAGADDAGPRRIVYDRADPVARALAERIVALVDGDALAEAVPGLDGDAVVVASGTREHELNARMKNGDDFGYVVALPYRPAEVCFEVRRLIHRAHWLLDVENELADALIPLVVTRQHVIARKDRVGVSVDWYGNVHIHKERP
jgi:hypothetical protein